MTSMKLIPILMVIIVSSLFLGCIKPEETAGTPIPEATPKVTQKLEPTVVPTYTPAPSPTPVRVSEIYRADVDNYRGFQRIVSNSSKPVNYDVYNRTLTITVGDTMIWINDATDPEEKLTIVSEEGLWDMNETRAVLRWNRAQFNYTFKKDGKYSFYIKEYPRIEHLKIIVNP